MFINEIWQVKPCSNANIMPDDVAFVSGILVSCESLKCLFSLIAGFSEGMDKWWMVIKGSPTPTETSPSSHKLFPVGCNRCCCYL